MGSRFVTLYTVTVDCSFSIHDHTNSHCFVKMLDGELLETKFSWPDPQAPEAPLKVLEKSVYDKNGVSYMSGKSLPEFFDQG